MADNSIDGQILSEITALKNNQIESNRRMPHVMDELKKQNVETAKEVAAGQTKQWIALREKIASNDPSNTEAVMKANLVALENLQQEMETTRDQGSKDAYESQKLLDKQIEDQKFAALSPAERKEAEEDQAKGDEKSNKFMKMISGGIGWLVESGKKVGKAAKLGAVAFLSTLAIGGLLIALGKFLQSDTFKNMTKFISEVIMPKLMEFWEFVKDNWVEIGIVIASFLAAFVIVKAAMIGAKIVKTIQLIGVAFSAVKAFFAATMLPAVTAMMVPLLPFIAIAAAIGVVLYALWNAFKDAKKTFDETGSIGEALKVGISKFIGTIVGFVPMLILKLVSWVAGLFGFDDFASQVDAIDPIQWISDTISDMIDGIVNWFDLLFTDPIAAIKKAVGGYISLFTDFGGFVYKKAIKPAIDWIGGLFGVEDASGQMEGYIGKKLDNIINFAGAIYDKYIKPIVDWFSNLFNTVVKNAKESPAGKAIGKAMDMAKNFIKTALLAVLPKPGGSKLSVGYWASKAIPDSLYEYAGMDPKTGEVVKQTAEAIKEQNKPVKMRDISAAKNAEFKAMKLARGEDGKTQNLDQYEKDRLTRAATASAGAGGGPTNIVDARQSSSVTTTGSSGQSPIRNNKFGSLNKSAEAAGF
jgi:hypothetical protein